MAVAPPEIRIVLSRKIACDGGEGALGHPRVWLAIPEETGYAECGYCDAKYVLKGREADADVNPG